MGSVRRPPVEPIRLDGAIGAQRNSLRPTSARFSFSSRPRFPEERSSQDTPGPGDYQYPSVFRGPSPAMDPSFHGVSAVIGTAGSSVNSRHEEQDTVHEPEVAVPDSARLKFNAPPRATFGKEERMGKAMDFESLRACPDHGYGSNSPGLIYSPHERPARPRSAPGYTIRGRKAQGATQKRSSTPTKVAPNSYPGAREDAIGVQRTSRRRTASASSFGRADRFPAPKPASGTCTEECMNVRSAFGDQRSGQRASGVHVGFGSARREGTAHAAANREAQAGDKLNLPHPPLAPRQEILRYGDNLGKNF